MSLCTGQSFPVLLKEGEVTIHVRSYLDSELSHKKWLFGNEPDFRL